METNLFPLAVILAILSDNVSDGKLQSKKEFMKLAATVPDI